MRDGGSVRGLSTAATVWATGAIGMLAGYGFVLEAAEFDSIHPPRHRVAASCRPLHRERFADACRGRALLRDRSALQRPGRGLAAQSDHSVRGLAEAATAQAWRADRETKVTSRSKRSSPAPARMISVSRNSSVSSACCRTSCCRAGHRLHRPSSGDIRRAAAEPIRWTARPSSAASSLQDRMARRPAVSGARWPSAVRSRHSGATRRFIDKADGELSAFPQAAALGCRNGRRRLRGLEPRPHAFLNAVISVPADQNPASNPSRKAGIPRRRSGWLSPAAAAGLEELRPACAAEPRNGPGCHTFGYVKWSQSQLWERQTRVTLHLKAIRGRIPMTPKTLAGLSRRAALTGLSAAAFMRSTRLGLGRRQGRRRSPS